MTAAITSLVVGGVAAAWAGIAADANFRAPFERLRLRGGSVAFDLLTSTGLLLPVYGADRLASGQSAWTRIGWVVVAFLGAVLLFAVPYRLRRWRTRNQPQPLAEVGIGRRPIRKCRT
jgi:hypothetical protein